MELVRKNRVGGCSVPKKTDSYPIRLLVCAVGGIYCSLYAVYAMACRLHTHNARLQDDTQRWDLLLATEGEHKGSSGVCRDGAAVTCERERHTHDNGVVQNESYY